MPPSNSPPARLLPSALLDAHRPLVVAAYSEIEEPAGRGPLSVAEPIANLHGDELGDSAGVLTAERAQRRWRLWSAAAACGWLAARGGAPGLRLVGYRLRLVGGLSGAAGGSERAKQLLNQRGHRGHRGLQHGRFVPPRAEQDSFEPPRDAPGVAASRAAVPKKVRPGSWRATCLSVSFSAFSAPLRALRHVVEERPGV